MIYEDKASIYGLLPPHHLSSNYITMKVLVITISLLIGAVLIGMFWERVLILIGFGIVGGFIANK